MFMLEPKEMDFINQNLENAQELINSEDINDLLSALDDWIAYYSYDEDWSFNDEGRKAQNMYDDIYYRNIAEYE